VTIAGWSHRIKDSSFLTLGAAHANHAAAPAFLTTLPENHHSNLPVWPEDNRIAAKTFLEPRITFCLVIIISLPHQSFSQSQRLISVLVKLLFAPTARFSFGENTFRHDQNTSDPAGNSFPIWA